MQAPWSPPLWWTFRFQARAHDQYDTDRLSGCEQSFVLEGSCYWIRFGQEVWKTSGDALCAKRGTESQNTTTYTYLTSTYGIQTYRSKVSCLPMAAYSELLVQVVDIGRQDINRAILPVPCRTMIQIAMDTVSMEAGCNNVYEAIYNSYARSYANGPAHQGPIIDEVD